MIGLKNIKLYIAKQQDEFGQIKWTDEQLEKINEVEKIWKFLLRV